MSGTALASRCLVTGGRNGPLRSKRVNQQQQPDERRWSRVGTRRPCLRPERGGPAPRPSSVARGSAPDRRGGSVAFRKSYSKGGKRNMRRRGFTLIELLV